MKRKSLFQLSIRSILALTVVGAIVAYQFRPREASAKINLVSVDAPNHQAIFEIKNTARNDIWLYGYSVTSPLYSISGRSQNGDWVSMPVGWCGAGAGMRRLKKGEARQFDVSWFDKFDKIKVSVSCQDNDSEELESESIESDPVNVKAGAARKLTAAP